MVTPAFVQTMARYNRWMNDKLAVACERLSDAELREEQGAFWGSILGTLNHILWADVQWMTRFADVPKPRVATGKESPQLHPDFPSYRTERIRFDAFIVDWAAQVTDDWLASDLRYYSGIAKRELVRNRGMLMAHYFNHQTHHRGQVHCLLTRRGIDPGDTDLPFLFAD